MGLVDVLRACHAAAGDRWANFLAVDYYKVVLSGPRWGFTSDNNFTEDSHRKSRKLDFSLGFEIRCIGLCILFVFARAIQIGR
jgi:hypothetical protein